MFEPSNQTILSKLYSMMLYFAVNNYSYGCWITIIMYYCCGQTVTLIANCLLCYTFITLYENIILLHVSHISDMISFLWFFSQQQNYTSLCFSLLDR